MNDVSIISILGLGFVLGLKHSVDADHVAAVSTIASEQASIFSASFVGALWGIGHTIALLATAGAILLFRLEITERMSLVLEFIVGVMLIALGVNALLNLLSGGHLHMHVHCHGGRVHSHPHIHRARRRNSSYSHHGLKIQRRPTLVGLVHGLAGSGALMLLILPSIRQSYVALLYVLIFGAGATAGMTIMSALVGLPVKLSMQRLTWANTFLRGAAGVFSVALGLSMAYEIGYRKLFE